ncbi:MAG: nucleotidyltransferase family protein [Candidatus Omnitrophota bacterium]
MPKDLSADISAGSLPGKDKHIAGYNLLVIERTEKVLGLFNREGIRTILLKGIALLQDIYKNPSERILSDVDILIRPEELQKAESILSGAGYRFAGTNNSNAVVYKISSEPDIFLDLHYHLYNHLSPSQEKVYEPDEKTIWERAVPVRLGQEETRVLGPEDRIIYLCFHLLKERFSNHKWLKDLSLLIREKQDDIDETEFIRAAKSSGTYKLCSMTIDHLNKIQGTRIKLLRDRHPENEFRMYRFEKAVFGFLLKCRIYPLREALWLIAMDTAGKKTDFFIDLLKYIPKKVRT